MEQLSVKDYNPDIKTHWDRIFIGPFGEILRLLSEFNSKYDTTLGITNKLSWKRGCYNQVKEAMSVVADAIKMRPKNMHSIFSNRRRFGWRGRTLETDITRIQNKMSNLKWQGARVDYNSAVDAFNKAKEGMIIDTDDIKKVDKDISISMYVESNDDIVEDTLCIEYVVSNIVLKISGHDEQGNIFECQRFECGDVHIKATRNVFHYINGSNCWQFDCTYHPNDEILIHPYVSKSTGAYHGQYRHHCFGDFDSNFRVSLDNMDIFGFAVSARRWLSEFITNKTVPLNGPSKLYIGNPRHLNQEFVIRHAKSANDCDNIMSKEMLFQTQPEDFEFNPQSQETIRGSDSKWHLIASRIKEYVSHSYYLETVKENLDRRTGTMHSPITSPENFLTAGRIDDIYKTEDEITSLITNAAKWGANKCQEIECTLRDSCRFGYQLKVIADTLTEEEVAIEKESKQDAALVYIRLKTVTEWCRDILYDIQDEDPDVYENIPEELRKEFHNHYNNLMDFLRGHTNHKNQVNDMFRMWRIDQLKPRNTDYQLDRFLTTLSDTEIAMNRLVDYLGNPDGHKEIIRYSGKLAKVKKYVPDWDNLSSEEQDKAMATLINVKLI